MELITITLNITTVDLVETMVFRQEKKITRSKISKQLLTLIIDIWQFALSNK